MGGTLDPHNVGDRLMPMMRAVSAIAVLLVHLMDRDENHHAVNYNILNSHITTH